MDKEACDAIAFMATILGNLTRGYSIEVEDIWKLDERRKRWVSDLKVKS